MSTTPDNTPVSNAARWAGRIMSWLPSLLLAFSAVMKLAKPQPVLDGFAQYGIPASLISPIGVIQLICVAIYLIPRTAVLGAILLTGYAGGAILTNLRVGKTPDALMLVVLGVLLWGGLFLRDRRLRALIPFTR
ncbi:MAG: DoxX family protein [Verrucomicrobia bacterium]|nr:DoxX family protein [Verrucomicrobiota bacterium]